MVGLEIRCWKIPCKLYGPGRVTRNAKSGAFAFHGLGFYMPSLRKFKAAVDAVFMSSTWSQQCLVVEDVREPLPCLSTYQDFLLDLANAQCIHADP